MASWRLGVLAFNHSVGTSKDESFANRRRFGRCRATHMTDSPPKKPDPPDPPDPHALHYRPPAPEPASQWWTDDQPNRGWVIPTLLVLTAAGSVIGVAFTVATMFLGC